ncbi:SDR family NAD(P)-dependent oxidoreductase [Pseudonocardia sp. CA-107938]|uniref:SDR family NAD(P)-dependent oxidoreductase n=1 Tax=Pseudonocardia sp. CA-107938 TaxID=3240021 RepID=UPI003D91F098
MTSIDSDLTGHVAIVSGREPERVGRIADQLRQRGATVEVVAAATRAEAEAAVSRCVAQHSRLDIVVNAGWPRPGPGLLATTDDELLAAWRDVVATAFHLAQAAIPQMVSRGYGRIVEIADAAGLLYAHDGELAAHDMTMGALTAMMRTIAAEAKADGVATNAVLAVPVDGAAVAPVEDSTVVAAATWLAGPRCDVSGRFFAAGGARLAEVFTWAGHGYQSPDPSTLSIEEVRDNWAAALSPADGIAPVDQVEYNGFRTSVYRATVT